MVATLAGAGGVPVPLRLGGPRRLPTRAVALVTVMVALLGQLALVSQSRPVAETPADTSRAWPAGLREAAGAAVAADAYAIEAQGGDWRAANPDQGLAATFSASGLSVAPSAGDAWTLGLSTTGVGRGDALAPAAPAEVVAEGGRIEYRRGDLTEWYVNDARGIEQGFTLLAPPVVGEGPVVVELGLSTDLVPRLSDDARGLVLSDAAGVDVARYDGLVAFDAAGADLPAYMELADGMLRLVVDDAGAAYPLTIDPVINTQQAELTAGDAAAFDEFGYSVAVSGDTAVVGASKDAGDNLSSGSAYVFVRMGATWAQEAKLVASDAAAFDEFGYSVAVSGDTAVVGAPFDDDAGTNSGSAYVFAREGTDWTQEAKLTAGDADAFDSFGISVAITDDTAVVGAYFAGDGDADSGSGAAYVFARAGTDWTQEAKLTAGDIAADALFGNSVAVTGNTAVVGAFSDSGAGDNAGAAYVFVRTGSTWTQEAKLTAGDAGDTDLFGNSVAVAGDTIVVGANGDDDAIAGSDSGSAYVFVRTGTTWTQQAKLTAGDAAAADLFGTSVAVADDTAVVGSYRDDGAGPDSGSAYVFVRAGTTWTQQAKLTAVDAAPFDFFGYSVAVSGDTAVVGAIGSDGAGINSGSAYVYVPEVELTATLTVVADGTGTGTVTSDPAGIECGTDCEEAFPDGTAVTLTATPDTGSTFAGFVGCDSAAGDECTVTLESDTAVTATFTATVVGSTVVEVGGSVRSNGARSQVPVTFTCTAGEVFLLEVVLTQGDATGSGRARAACSGSPQSVVVRVTTAPGQAFVAGAAGACATIANADPGARTVNDSAEDCGDVVVTLG